MNFDNINDLITVILPGNVKGMRACSSLYSRKFIIRENNIYFRLISLFQVDFTKSTRFRISVLPASRKHLRTKVTPDLHLRYSKNWGNLGLVLKDKKWKFLHKIICCGDLLESPRRHNI